MLTGESVPLDGIIAAIGSPILAKPDVVVIDDFHLLSKEARTKILAQVPKSFDLERILILAGRRISRQLINTLSLEHLADDEVITLLTELKPWLGQVEAMRALPRILALSAGVPLFAIELAKTPGAEVNLTLLMIIASRLDGLNLDWALLQLLATTPDGMDITTLAQNLGDSKDQIKTAVGMAMRAGVLSSTQDAAGKIFFRHPLVREAINLLCI